ncbi:uncharacterized protein [Argopecten irradians]|uniref:uncharacterized protein n=1 Tax=Argopecten irradians TaxID=31199 RepID=UPI0037108DCA
MAASSVETKPAAQVFPVSPLCTANRTPSQSPSKLSVHSSSADVHPSEILPQDYNGNVSLSVSPALHGGEDSTMDIMGIKIGMIIDLDNPAGVSCDFCGGNYKDDVCKQCLRVNHPKYQPMNSDRPKSAPPYNCDTLKETSCKCDCKSGDEDIIQNLRNSNSGPKSLLENSKHSGSHRKSHSKKLKRTGSSRKHNGKRTACSVDTSGSLDNTQDNRDTKHVRKFRSNDPSNATIGTYPHTTISVGTGNKHQSESLLHTSQEDIPGLTPILQEENIMDRKKDDNDEVSNTPNGEDPEYVQILKNEPEATFSLRTLTRKQKCIVLSFCIVGFANYLCLSLIAPFFPKEARNKGISNMVSGWIFAAFPLTQFIFAPAFGKLIPIVGLKFMHLSGTFVGGGCTILFGMMEYVDVNDGTGVFITMCFILRFVQALGCCANQTASFSLCAQEFRDTVGTIFGMGEVFVGLGFMCGPAIGGVLYGIGGFVIQKSEDQRFCDPEVNSVYVFDRSEDQRFCDPEVNSVYVFDRSEDQRVCDPEVNSVYVFDRSEGFCDPEVNSVYVFDRSGGFVIQKSEVCDPEVNSVYVFGQIGGFVIQKIGGFVIQKSEVCDPEVNSVYVFDRSERFCDPEVNSVYVFDRSEEVLYRRFCDPENQRFCDPEVNSVFMYLTESEDRRFCDPEVNSVYVFDRSEDRRFCDPEVNSVYVFDRSEDRRFCDPEVNSVYVFDRSEDRRVCDPEVNSVYVFDRSEVFVIQKTEVLRDPEIEVCDPENVTVICGFILLVVPDQTQQTGNKMSLFKLFKSYSTIVNCFTIVIAAMIWSILDPTLEPHLEEFNLSSELIGLLFLLMAAVYAIASPFWGRISDKMADSRPILVIGCLMSSGGMLLLGPSTLLGFQQDDNILWLNVVSLVIIGIADSAAIIPTFDLLFKIAEDRGFENNINTFGIISGVWASMYALGDFLGPAVGGFLLDEIGFQSMTTYIAFLTVATAAFLFINILVDCACKSRKSAKKGSAEETSPLLSQKQDTDRYTENSDFLNTYPPQQLATEQV